MKNLGYTALGAGLVGILIVIIAFATWPKFSYLDTTANPSVNIAWLSVGCALIGVAALAALLAMHAGAIEKSHEKLATEIAKNIPLAQEQRERHLASLNDAATRRAARASSD